MSRSAHTKTQTTDGGLGFELPDTEHQLFQLDHLPILDIKFAQEFFQEDWEKLLSEMLSLFLSTLPAEKALLESAHAQHHWEQVEKLAHKMKSGCLYMGTKKLVIACQYLERYLKAGHKKQSEPLYQQMMTVINETVPILNVWLKTQSEPGIVN